MNSAINWPLIVAESFKAFLQTKFNNNPKEKTLMKLTIDPVPISSEKPPYFDFIVKGLKYLANIQNDDGSWGKKKLTTFQKIYYTTQVTQCLLKAGFPLTSETVQDALAYLDNFKEVSIENRAKFFLYLPLGKLSENELREYLELLKRIRRDNGSFFYEIRDLKGEEVKIDEWPGVRRGSFIFYTTHVLHFLSMIPEEKYRNLTPLKNDIWNKSFEMLLKQLEKAKPPYTLRDPTSGRSDPELTAYALSLLRKIEYQIPNFSEVIRWLLSQQVGGSWLNSYKITSFIVIDLSTLCFNEALLPSVKKAIEEAMRWLIKQKEKWEKNPNLTALVISALIFGNTFLDPGFYDAFIVNYSENLRKEIAERESQIQRAQQRRRIQSIISFILGIAIPLILKYIVIPLLLKE